MCKLDRRNEDPGTFCKFKWGESVLQVAELTVGEYADRSLASITPRGCASPYLWESMGVDNRRLWITRLRDRDPIYVLMDNGSQVLGILLKYWVSDEAAFTWIKSIADEYAAGHLTIEELKEQKDKVMKPAKARNPAGRVVISPEKRGKAKARTKTPSGAKECDVEEPRAVAQRGSKRSSVGRDAGVEHKTKEELGIKKDCVP